MGRAIIFDLDGTLVDTIGDIGASVNGALAELGYPARTREELYRLVGNGMRVLVTRCLPEKARTEERIEACLALASARYAASPAALSVPYPGVQELLAELGRRGVPCAVLSNKPDPLTRPLVEAVLPGHGLRIVRGEVPGRPRKPDPAVAREIAAELGAEPAETIFLGDSDVDVLTARNAGFFAVGAAWGFRGRAELEGAGADQIIDAPMDLLALF